MSEYELNTELLLLNIDLTLGNQNFTFVKKDFKNLVINVVHNYAGQMQILYTFQR